MAKYLNAFFITLTAFFPAFCWTYYATKVPLASLLAGALCSAAALALCALYIKNPPAKSKSLKKEAEKLAMHFALTGEDETVCAHLKYLGYAVEKESRHCYLAEKDGTKYYVGCRFTVEPISADDVISCAQSAKDCSADGAVLLCASCKQECLAYAKLTETKVTVCQASDVYQWLDKYGKLPDVHQVPPPKLRPAAKFAFNAKRFPYYFSSAVFLFVISLISYFPLYTLLWATALSFLALYCKVNKRFNPKDECLCPLN
ncbi:MAG: hypothetical protein NC350_06060 [Corallococcus sp.]|nr:hypothetical protein [Corallococcus sp.]